MKKRTVLLSAVACVGLPVLQASAALSFDLNTVFNGTTPPSATPYLTATFTSTAVNTVTLTLTSKLPVSPALNSGEYIGNFAFNIDPSFSPKAVNASPVTGSGFSGSLLAKDQNDQNPHGFSDPNGRWDFQIKFATAI